MTEWQKSGERIAVRTAVRFPLQLALHLKTEEGTLEATTRNVSSNGLLFVADRLPRVGSRVEFTIDMPAEVMGLDSGISVHCTGRIVRHQTSPVELMAAAVIDEYTLKA